MSNTIDNQTLCLVAYQVAKLQREIIEIDILQMQETLLTQADSEVVE